jgi:PAS domain S-box-containing protein
MKMIHVCASEIFNASILIVDHYDTNTLSLKRLLENSGYKNVSSTEDFHGVIPLHRTHHFDLILLNFRMPGITDADLITGLQKIEKECFLPVLAIADESAHTLHALPDGARDFIKKPFDMLEVKTRIHNMLVMRFLERKIEDCSNHVESGIQKRIAELEKRTAHFRGLIELSSDWYWEQDHNGNFTEVSGPVLEMLGLKACSSRGAQAKRTQYDKSAQDQLDANIAAKRPFIDFAYSLIKPDGSPQFLRVSGEPVFDKGGRFVGYRGVGVDVSEHMEMEQRLSRFQKISGDRGDAILWVDSVDQHLLDANEAAVNLLGYTREKLLTLDFGNIARGAQPSGRNKKTADNSIDLIKIKDKNGSSFPAEMLQLNARRSGEKNMSVIFIHKI